MTTLSDIRERDAEPVHAHDYMTHAHVDRRYLLQLLDAYQAREREAAAALENFLCDTDPCDCSSCVIARAWLAAPPVEGEGE